MEDIFDLISIVVMIGGALLVSQIFLAYLRRKIPQLNSLFSDSSIPAQTPVEARKESAPASVETKKFKLTPQAARTALGFLCLALVAFSAYSLLKPVETLVRVRASQLIPVKVAPVARFTASIDWDQRKLELDASMSKASTEIQNYIWRIDDGTSLVGSENFSHTFTDPGYYRIQMSVVDQDDQSDVATCQILVPPEELESVAVGESIDRNGEKTINYEWSPKGTFYNYSKMEMYDRSYANLLSRFVDTGCGYSNRAYNASHDTYTDFFRDDKVQQALILISRYVLFIVIAIPATWFVGRWAINKWLVE